MFDNLFSNYLDTKNKAIFNLELVELERLANTLIFIGVIIASQADDILQQSIVLGQTQQLSSQEESAFTYDAANLLTLANLLYLVANSIYLDTTQARLKEDKASISQNPSLSGLNLPQYKFRSTSASIIHM